MDFSVAQAGTVAQVLAVLVLAVAFSKHSRGKLATEVVTLQDGRRVRIAAAESAAFRPTMWWNFGGIVAAIVAIWMNGIILIQGGASADSWSGIIGAIAAYSSSVAIGILPTLLLTEAWVHVRARSGNHNSDQPT